MTSTESTVAEVWAETLQLQCPINATDNFFSLGGDSLAMMMTVFRVNEMFSLTLDTSTISEAPTLGEFCRRVDASRSGSHAIDASPSVSRFSRTDTEEGVL